jgi:hypothetical protein
MDTLPVSKQPSWSQTGLAARPKARPATSCCKVPSFLLLSLWRQRQHHQLVPVICWLIMTFPSEAMFNVGLLFDVYAPFLAQIIKYFFGSS